MSDAALTLHPSRSETFPFGQRVITIGGTPITYFDAGDGPAVVLVHGLGGNITHFEYVAAMLHHAGYRVCGLDLPGFGLSGKPVREYTVEYLASAMLELLDRLRIDHATLVGHSLGGLVCADAALRATDRVERLVLISSAGIIRMPLAFRLMAKRMMHPRWLAPALERTAHRVLRLVLTADNERTRRFVHQATSRPGGDFCVELARVMWAMRRDLLDYHLHDDVERIAVPTLIIWGRQDRLLPFKSVPAWAKRLRGARLEVIEQCGHMPIIEQPEAVVARMKEFLPVAHM